MIELNFSFDFTELPSPHHFASEPSLELRRALADSITSPRQLVESKGEVQLIPTYVSDNLLKWFIKSIALSLCPQVPLFHYCKATSSPSTELTSFCAIISNGTSNVLQLKSQKQQTKKIIWKVLSTHNSPNRKHFVLSIKSTATFLLFNHIYFRMHLFILIIAFFIIITAFNRRNRNE